MYSKDALALRHAGEHIRQLRRQRGLTQAELGGELYSKSYVSAVERGSIAPSLPALSYFAQQLNKPHDYFEQFLQQRSEAEQFLLPIHTPSLLRSEIEAPEVNTLLELLLTQSSLYPAVHVRKFAALPLEDATAFPSLTQARYVFFKGLLAQKESSHTLALAAFEYALVLTSGQYQIAVLDAIGMHYAFLKRHDVALSYHERALAMTEKGRMDAELIPAERDRELLLDQSLLVELHCGDDSWHLGLYARAVKYYTSARNHLRNTHDISVTGQVYLGLGYCLYASLYQQPPLLALADTDEAQEHTFQQAIGFLLQSRMLYQASQDLSGEAQARLLQALVLLDFSAWKQQHIQPSGDDKQAFVIAQCRTLLENAQEQCEQILLGWRNADTDEKALTAEEATISSALAYLVRVYCQHARLGRLENHSDTARLAYTRAANLCQKLLEIVMADNLSWAMINQFLALSKECPRVDASLPRPPELSLLDEITRSSVSQHAIYLAIAHVAEERAKLADTADYAELCFSYANAYCRLALMLIRRAVEEKECDPGYATRSYLQCMNMLQARTALDSPLSEEAAQELLQILKEQTPFY